MGSFTAKVNGWKVLNYRCKALHLRCFWWSWLRLCLNLNTTQKFNPTNIYLFKLNKRYTRKRCEICSKLTIKTPERRQWKLWKYFKPFSSVFTFDFDQVRLWQWKTPFYLQWFSEVLARSVSKISHPMWPCEPGETWTMQVVSQTCQPNKSSKLWIILVSS